MDGEQKKSFRLVIRATVAGVIAVLLVPMVFHLIA